MISHIGSSPLARGLLFPLQFRGIFMRIIPARAGFTTVNSWLGQGRKDHPRSRGVYAVFLMPSR